MDLDELTNITMGTCNLCLSSTSVKSMLISHTHKDSSETYRDMLIKCFQIDISSLEIGDTKQVICLDCIEKLVETSSFRDIVELSLKTLEESWKQSIKVDAFNRHNSQHDDFEFEDVMKASSDFDAEDDEILSKMKRESPRPVRTKPRVRRKADLSDTEALLEAGLFPFKVCRSGKFACTVCLHKHANLDDLRSHSTDHNKKTLHVAFKKMLLSKSHRFYKSCKSLNCKLCKAELTNYEALKLHLQDCIQYDTKWNSLPFKLEKDRLDCPICSQTFLNFVSLNTHMNVHYPNHICDSCGKAFATKARLRGHTRIHEVGEFPCKYCGVVFDRVTKREHHISKEHKSGQRYACKRCNISMSSFYARQKHLAEVHNEELKRYKCKVCPQSYITPGHLSSHIRRDHLNERNHKCEKCDQAFYTRNSLQMHMIKHDGERIFACHICGKSYQRKKTLREHMRIHDNDKRFVCPVCGRAFTQKCTLKGHLKVHEKKTDVSDLKIEQDFVMIKRFHADEVQSVSLIGGALVGNPTAQ